MSNILIIGSGGREHALAWKIAQDNRVRKIYIAPGNGGTEYLDKCENVQLSNIEDLVDFAKNNNIRLTIVGPENYLIDGIVDAFKAERLSIFGPDKKAAHLEGSKSYAKHFMQEYGVKTAQYESFKDSHSALQYLASCRYPVVVKADGAAAGKGVIICQDEQDANQAVKDLMLDKRFGSAGDEIVIEEFLTGFEVSILSFCDGNTILPMLSAKDHKTIGEHNTGENTGGMGAVAPHPSFTEDQYQAFIKDVLNPTMEGIKSENMSFAGIIFFGLMINDRGVYLLEYNMRFGDPETQTILPLLKTNLLDIIDNALEKNLNNQTLTWRNKSAVCVVAASQGYPRKFEKNIPINHVENARLFSEVFIAGAQFDDGQLFTTGGRVLNVVGLGSDLQSARQSAYNSMNMIEFKGKTVRSDIGE